MPWISYTPQRFFSRLLGLDTVLRICRQICCWTKSLGRLGAFLLRLVQRSQPSRRVRDYGHLLLEALYPGQQPSADAVAKSRSLFDQSRKPENFDQELRLLSEAVLLNPPDPSLYLARAEAHMERGQFVEALDNAELCVSIEPHCPAGWLVRGRAENSLGRSADAALSYQTGLLHDVEHRGLIAAMDQIKGVGTPGPLSRLREVVAATRLRVEELHETVEDPDRTTEAFVEENHTELEAQLCVLSQTLRVNVTILFASPVLCDAYQQVVFTCSQLVAGAPAAFSRLRCSGDVLEGLSLALRVGWHLHHSIPKLAANGLVALALCQDADTDARKQAIRQLFGGLLRWLLDARPEPEEEEDEVCGCSCFVPWKAAACFVERLFDSSTVQPLVQAEIEAWPDIAQFCQWLTLSVRDYHATPIGLVGLLRLPGVASAVMRSEAMVDFFIRAIIYEYVDDRDPSDQGSGPQVASDANSPRSEVQRPLNIEGGPFHGFGVARAFLGKDAPADQEVTGDLDRQHQMSSSLSGGAVAMLGGRTVSSMVAQVIPPPLRQLPPQRLGDWLLASVGYLLIFIEGDALFTISACHALIAMVEADLRAGGDGSARLVRSLWLGVPLLSRLSALACHYTAALDLLHCLFESPSGDVRSAARSLARFLSRQPPPPPTAPATLASGNSAASSPELFGLVPDVAGTETWLSTDPRWIRQDIVPSWAEFYQELMSELTCHGTSSGMEGNAEVEEAAADHGSLVTLADFEEKARILEAQTSVFVEFLEGFDDGSLSPSTDVESRAIAPSLSSLASSTWLVSFSCPAVPASWSRCASAVNLKPLRLFYDPTGGEDIGSEAYLNDTRMRGKVVLMSRRSIRQSTNVINWAQAVAAAAKAGALAVVVFNNLDGAEPFCMGLFGEPPPAIPAFMLSGADGSELVQLASTCRRSGEDFGHIALRRKGLEVLDGQPPPWPLACGRVATDVAQAWSLLEALSAHDSTVRPELDALVGRMDAPEKRVWLTRHLVRHHRAGHIADDGGLIDDLPLAFVEADRASSPKGQLEAVRRQMVDKTGLGTDDLCGYFEARFLGEQGVGSAVLREWIDTVAREAFLHPSARLLKSCDGGQYFWPDPAAVFCNPQWKMDYEAIGRLLGLALWQRCTVDLPLHPHVCALLFGFPRSVINTTLRDMDADLHRTKVEWLLEHPVAELGVELAFADTLCSEADGREVESAPEGEIEASERGPDESNIKWQGLAFEKTQANALKNVVTLADRLQGDVRCCPGRPLRQLGAAEVLLVADALEEVQVLTDGNKHAYVRALQEWRLYSSISPQVDAMARGLGEVLPAPLLPELRTLLTPNEISQMLSGSGAIDVDDWEKHTAYSHGLSPGSTLVKWFWRTLRSWAAFPATVDRLPQLLQFVSGSTRVPVGGFNELVGFNGSKHPFTLAKADHLTVQALPTVHACICTLDLPSYEDYETLGEKLLKSLTLGRSRFDEGVGAALRGDIDGE